MSAEGRILRILRDLLHVRGMRLDERGTAEITIPLADGGVLHLPVQELIAAPDED